MPAAAPETEHPASNASVINANGWKAVVDRIQQGDPAGEEQLYTALQKGMRGVLGRQLGPQDLDDRVHDIFVAVVKAVKAGQLHEPERIMGFARTITQRKAAESIGALVQRRTKEVNIDDVFHVRAQDDSPEEAAIRQQRRGVLEMALSRLPKSDAHLLRRFYIDEHPKKP